MCVHVWCNCMPACILCLSAYTVHASEQKCSLWSYFAVPLKQMEAIKGMKDKEKSRQTEGDEGGQCYSSVCPAAVWLMCESLTLSGHSLITCSVFRTQTHTSIFIAGLYISTITHRH